MSDVRRLVLAFDIGGTTIKAAAYDAALRPLAGARRPSPRGPAVVDALAGLAEEVLAALPPDRREDVVAAGAVALGLVDEARGVMRRAVNLDVTDLEVAGPLSRLLGVPTVLGHDVEQAAIAEVEASPTEVRQPFVVVIGTGIAAATFVDGAPLRGVSGQAGELGHVVVRPDGRRCPCGAVGCLETVASAAAIARDYSERTGTAVTGASDVLRRLGTDPVADEVWAEATSALADALVMVCTLLAPGEIVLGGGLAEAGDALVEPVRTTMLERSYVATVPPIRASVLGSRAGLVGAAGLALRTIGAR
ncbi:ROK family protein [Nocardioides sp. CER19]|uniref:ROK family protein n=1 Tax=Nocardioides sp. CER19 TaxID=3038538 RepID=UPI0024493AB1|nr:ROK family protein [Nocardioides sp. CER19]MDH2414079.1 ROK family protein [Nocardioides sp. CER19]